MQWGEHRNTFFQNVIANVLHSATLPLGRKAIVMFAIILKKSCQIGGRVSELARKLLELECAETGESQGEVLERCLLQCVRHPDALKLIQEYARKDPALSAILAACFPTGKTKN